LRLDGHDVTECANAEDALAAFRERPFPIVITDVVMPGRSGLDLLREVKLLPVPARRADGRANAAGRLLKTFGAMPVQLAARTSRRLVTTMAVGADAHPAIASFVYELFVATPPAGRGGKAKTALQAVAITMYLTPLPGWVHPISVTVMVVAVVLTVLTGLDYVVKLVRIMRGGPAG